MTGPEPRTDSTRISLVEAPTTVRLLPWRPDDLELLRRTNTADATEYLGGIETEAQLLQRHDRYLSGPLDGSAYFYSIEVDGRRVGHIGYWYGLFRGLVAYETSWSIVPEARGQGFEAMAVRQLLVRASAFPVPRFVHALLAGDDRSSNAVCITAGFDRVDTVELGEPPSLYADWAFDLAAIA